MRLISMASALAAAVGFAALLPEATFAAAIRGKLEVEPKPFIGTKNVNPIGEPEPGGGQVPEAMLQILSAEVAIQDAIPFGLSVTRGTLTPERAYGQGLPNGYTSPPPNNSSGPWQGLMWPYRDFNDGYATPTTSQPPGNSVGVIDLSQASSGQYFVSEMIGRMNYNLDVPSTYQRGSFIGSGLAARFFKIELRSLVDVDREVTVTLRNFRVLLLLRDTQGRLTTGEFAAPDTSITFLIPAPGAAGLLALGGLLATRRRRTA